MRALLCVLLLVALPQGWSRIVSWLVVPHGAIAMQPWHPFNGDKTPGARDQAYRLHTACKQLGSIASRADVVVLISPHDLADATRFGAPTNGFGKGSGSEKEGNYSYTTPEYKFALNAELARALLAALPNTTFVSSPSDDDSYPLLWGSVVPAMFLKPHSLVVVSLPSRRLVDNAVPMMDELRALGAAMATTLEQSQLRVAVAISGDLAHTHLCNGPYGCNPSASVFDGLVASWLRNTSDSQLLLVQAAQVVPQALSCGFAGLVMLSSMLEGAQASLQLLVGPYAPSYYGMLVAAFE